MAAQVWGVVRDGHHVARAHGDVPVAARTQIDLGGLVGLDEAGLDSLVGPEVGVCHARCRTQPRNAHATSAAQTSSATMTMR